jgi:hypothetical protein
MRLIKSLRTLLLGIWLVVTGLVLVVSTVISVMAHTARAEMA